jgi:hypothetical protein
MVQWHALVSLWFRKNMQNSLTLKRFFILSSVIVLLHRINSTDDEKVKVKHVLAPKYRRMKVDRLRGGACLRIAHFGFRWRGDQRHDHPHTPSNSPGMGTDGPTGSLNIVAERIPGIPCQ